MNKEPRPQPAYTLLTFGQYADINCKLSIAKGYDLTKPTQRVFTMNPPAAKYNIVRDSEGNITKYDVRVVMPVSSEHQIDYPEIFENVELVDSYEPVDSPIQELVVDITNEDTLNWTLVQFSVAGSKEDQLTLIISNETKAIMTEDMIEKVFSFGLNIE